MKSLIAINENFVKPDLSPDYFIKRIPFLKSANNNSNDKATRFQKVIYNPNVKMVIGDEIYIFPIFNTVIEFTYSKYMINNKYEFNVNLNFELIITKPNDMDSLLYTTIRIMNDMQMKKMSYRKNLFIQDEHIPSNILDEIINDVNKRFFEFEEYITEKLPANLKNPVDEYTDPEQNISAMEVINGMKSLSEQVSPTEVNTNNQSLQSIINKKRNIGTVFLNPDNKEEYNHLIKTINSQPDLNTLHINSNPYRLFIVYRNGYETQANKLKKLYDDNGGFITINAPDEVHRLEGELLGYYPNYIEQFIQQKHEKKTLNEYVINDIIYLKSYLNMSEKEKIDGLPYDYPYLFEDFIDEMNIDFETPSDDGIPLENYELPDWLIKNDPKLFYGFGKWLFEKINHHDLNISDQDYPAWSFYSFNNIVKNQWLIHFTNNAQDIATSGFNKGVNDMSKLGLTTHLSDFEKEYGGYNFAFLLKDFQRYGYSGWGSYKYGNEAVIFQASGLSVWHYGDEEPQVIFYGNTAKNIIPIIKSNEDNWTIYDNKTGNPLIENNDLEKVVNWLTKHYIQYRKRL